MNTTKKRTLIFLITTFLLTYIVAFLLMSNGGFDNPKASQVLSLIMLIPTFSVFTAQFFTREGFKSPYLKLNFRENISRYLLCYFLVQILIIVGVCLYFLLFPKRFDYNLSSIAEMIYTQTEEEVQQSRLYSLMAIQVVFSILSGPFMNILFAFGEEYGWRGYLFPKLCERFSPLTSAVITGVLWGVWYAPTVSMGYIYGKNGVGFPLSGIAAIIIFCVFASIVFSYFTYKTKSVFPAVLMHSALNVFSSVGELFDKYDANPFVGPQPYGIIGGMGFIICGILLAVLLRKEKTK